MLNGQIDHCHGRYVFGWAIPRDSGTRCRIVAVDQRGDIIAETTADIPREDLSVVGNGQHDFAFQLGIPFTDEYGPFHILADDIEIPGSPLYMSPDIVAGAIEIDSDRIAGWVADRHTVTCTNPVTIVDQDGAIVATVSPEPSADDTDPFFRPGRFTAIVPGFCFGRTELCLTARVGETTFAQTVAPMRLEGYVDRLTEISCDGWLFSPDAPHRRLTLVIYRDGKPVGTASTGLHRPDVGSRFPGAEDCGFTMTLKPETAPRATLAHISIRIAGSDHDILGGPFLMGQRAAMIEQAQDALFNDRLSSGTRATLQDAFAAWVHTIRAGTMPRLRARPMPSAEPPPRRMSIVVPVYADADATRTCLDSVLRCRDAALDTLVIVNDNPADPAIGALVDSYARHPNSFILRNATNLGFVGSANRGMEFLRAGDVLLLNADTELYAGALDEMHRVLQADPRTGTVTALSNNATLFSYPHPSLIVDELDDAGWAELAAIALRENAGQTAPIPTAHGFCMLIRRSVVQEVGLFDLSFGRGYGEENDFSLRAADRGWRHVVAGAAFVRHAEARSFGAEKETLAARNLDILRQRYPEYSARIDRFADTDPLRRLRWPLDTQRLRAAAVGRPYWLVIDNWLDGGTERAANDIADLVRSPNARMLRVTGLRDGMITLTADDLVLKSVFTARDGEALFGLLASLPIERVIVHHLLGFTQDIIEPLQRFLAERESIFHVHDFYYACPRVTMIDATGTFCGGAPADRCDRCLTLDGPHSAHRLEDASAAEHRGLFQSVLAKATHVVTPSQDAAGRLEALLPGTRPVAVPHPQLGTTFPIGVRRGSPTDICLLGAVGPHKGSDTLMALARYAALNQPDIRFHLVGFTNIDEDLEAIGNVTITGRYDPEDLPSLVEKTGARIALFLHGWPETFSYTLTEAVSLGLIPVVPDIGAPADRVRQAGFGVVFPFPIEVPMVMHILNGVANGSIAYSHDGGLPLGFDTAASHDRMRAIYFGEKPAKQAAAGKTLATKAPRRRRGSE